MEFRILGPLEVTHEGELLAFGGRRERAVMALLLLEANRLIPMERLIDAVWDDDPPVTARSQIQICISGIRRRALTLCGADLIETRSPGYLLQVEPGALDLHRFDATVALGRTRAAEGNAFGAADALREALAMWQGPALSDIHSRVVQLGVTRLAERRRAVLGEYFDHALRSGRHHEIVSELVAVVEEQPMREHFRAQLMTALYRSGRQAEALETYRHGRDVLMEELGLEPGAELQQLHQSMLTGDVRPRPVTRAERGGGTGAGLRGPGAGVGQPPRTGQTGGTAQAGRQQVSSSGPQGPQGLPGPQGTTMRPRTGEGGGQEAAAPEVIGAGTVAAGTVGAEMVGAAAVGRETAAPPIPAAPVTALAAAPVPFPHPIPDPPTPSQDSDKTPNLLPADIPDFTGRDELVRDIIEKTGGRHDPSDALRVCVIVGPGGAGKTTLAVHTAHQLAARFPDGRFFARLRGGDLLIHPLDILERFLRVLGVTGPALPKGLEERAEMFRNLLSQRRTLIVLDDAMSERQVASLLPGTPHSCVLVTSRRRLTGLPAAARVEIGALGRRSSIELLSRIVGAERIESETESVAQLCDLCGDMPLALRICAARLAARPHWSVADLLDRLMDESRRLDELSHDEMGVRASISLSYDALPEDARILFRRLALLEAPTFASWVGSPLLGADVYRAEEALEALVEAYLIDAEPGPTLRQTRYRFHDIMRPFARERLTEESAQERRDALERWFGALLELTGQARRRELGGFYLQQPSPASRWKLPERFVDRLLEDPLAWFEAERPGIVAAVRQAAASGMAAHCWDLAATAVVLFESHSCLDDWRATAESALGASIREGDRYGEAVAHNSLGSLYVIDCKDEEALRHLEAALAIFHELGDCYGTAVSLRELTSLSRRNGDFAAAAEHGYRALAVFAEAGDRIAEAHMLQSLAQVNLDTGREAEAAQQLERASEICREIGSRRAGAQVEYRLGELLAGRGDLDRAHTSYLAVLAAVRRLGDRIGECFALLSLGDVQLRRGETADGVEQLTEALKVARAAGARGVESRAALRLAEAAMADGRMEAALGLADQAVRGLESGGHRMHLARSLMVRGRIRAATGALEPAASDLASARSLLDVMDPRSEALGALAQLEADVRAGGSPAEA